jgi:hypothetical protein
MSDFLDEEVARHDYSSFQPLPLFFLLVDGLLTSQALRAVLSLAKYVLVLELRI